MKIPKIFNNSIKKFFNSPGYDVVRNPKRIFLALWSLPIKTIMNHGENEEQVA